MQTEYDIKKWESYLEIVTVMLKQGDSCYEVACVDCPFGFQNNGYYLTCKDLDLKASNPAFSLYKFVCDKYLKGDITFLDGKLVEVVDAN